METWGRIAVPWGPEPKAQVANSVRRARWHSDDYEDVSVIDFDPAEADFPVIYKSLPALPLPRAKGKTHVADAVAKWAVAKVFKDEVLARRLRSLVSSVYRPQTWADQISPSLLAYATGRATKRRAIERTKPRDPFSTRTRVRSLDWETQDWANQAPPSLLEWANTKGIKRLPVERMTPLDPFKTRTRVVSLEQRRQIAAALKRGEWCLVRDIDAFPTALKKWLLERCSFIRWVGGGRVSGTPVNGYVTEDGTVFYVAEDGSTFYVQES